MSACDKIDAGSVLVQDIFQAFDDFRKSGQLCDVTISVQGREIPAHRNILAACSAFFRALFTNGMRETINKTVEISEVDPVHFELLLDYVYTQRAQITSENVEVLLPLADRFEILGLRQACCKFMIRHLSADNAVDVWKFARSYLCSDLEKAVFRFILVHFEDITTSKFSAISRENFASLTIDELMEIIENEELNVKMEEYVFEAACKWISHDEKKRKEHMPRILLNIRLGMVSHDYLMNAVKKNRYVRNNDKCRLVIDQARKHMYPIENKSGPSRVILRPRKPYEVLFAIGGYAYDDEIQLGETNIVECYDTRADRWKTIDKENLEPLSYSVAVVLDKRIYLCGGGDGNRCSKRVWCLDSSTKEWIEVAPMYKKRKFSTGVVVGNHIYIMGGFDGRFRLATVERYDPLTNQWTLVEPMNCSRSDASACNLDGRIVITGGFTGSRTLSSCEMYDPESGEWNFVPKMSGPRSGHGCVAFQNSVYVVGGFDLNMRLNTMEEWSLGDGRWQECPKMYRHRSNFGVAVLDDMIFVIGGYNGSRTTSEVECFDLHNRVWYDAADMHTQRSGLSVCVVAGISDTSEYIWHRESNLPVCWFVDSSRRVREIEERASSSADQRDDDDHHSDDPLDPNGDHYERIPIPDRLPNEGRYEREICTDVLWKSTMCQKTQLDKVT